MTIGAAVVRKPVVMLKIKPVAMELGVSTHSVLQLIDSGRLRAVDVSAGRNPTRRSLRVPEDELHRFLGVNSTQTNQDIEAPQPPQPPLPPLPPLAQYLTVYETAKLLNKKHREIEPMVRAGLLKAAGIRGKKGFLLFLQSDVDEAKAAKDLP